MGCYIDLIVLCNETIYTSCKSKARSFCAMSLSGAREGKLLLVDRLLDPTEYSGMRGSVMSFAQDLAALSQISQTERLTPLQAQ
jgi:hypothetical protein